MTGSAGRKIIPKYPFCEFIALGRVYLSFTHTCARHLRSGVTVTEETRGNCLFVIRTHDEGLRHWSAANVGSARKGLFTVFFVVKLSSIVYLSQCSFSQKHRVRS